MSLNVALLNRSDIHHTLPKLIAPTRREHVRRRCQPNSNKTIHSSVEVRNLISPSKHEITEPETSSYLQVWDDQDAHLPPGPVISEGSCHPSHVLGNNLYI